MDILEPEWSKRLNHKTLRTEQLKDPFLSVVYQSLKDADSNGWQVATLPGYWQRLYAKKSLILKNKLVYNVQACAFAIPKSLRWEVLTYFHGNLASALHQGAQRT